MGNRKKIKIASLMKLKNNSWARSQIFDWISEFSDKCQFLWNHRRITGEISAPVIAQNGVKELWLDKVEGLWGFILKIRTGSDTRSILSNVEQSMHNEVTM